MLMHCIGESADIDIWQDYARCRLDMRRENDVRTLGANSFDRLLDGAGSERCVSPVLQTAGLEHSFSRWNRPRLENLRPTIREKAIADHQHFGTRRELAR